MSKHTPDASAEEVRAYMESHPDIGMLDAKRAVERTKPREMWVYTHGSTWIEWDGPKNMTDDFKHSGGRVYHVIEATPVTLVANEMLEILLQVQKWVNGAKLYERDDSKPFPLWVDLDAVLAKATGGDL